MNLEQKQEKLIAQMEITDILRILPYNKYLPLDRLQKKAQVYLSQKPGFAEETIEDITHQNIRVMSEYFCELWNIDRPRPQFQKPKYSCKTRRKIHNIPANRLVTIAAMTGAMCIIPAYYLLSNLL